MEMEMEMELSQSQLQFQIQKPLPILQKLETTTTHKKSQAFPRSLAGLKRHSFSRKQRMEKQRRVVVDEEEEVEGKITALQRVVPGGEGLGADELFEETAGYILALQSRVKALRALTSFFDGLEKEKMKFGG